MHVLHIRSLNQEGKLSLTVEFYIVLPECFLVSLRQTQKKRIFSFAVCFVVLMLKLQTLDTHRCVCVYACFILALVLTTVHCQHTVSLLTAPLTHTV